MVLILAESECCVAFLQRGLVQQLADVAMRGDRDFDYFRRERAGSVNDRY
jgi:hypothetical protein